jgi:uncharacterized membrane protein YphA (DoxX/SURF4 family)
MNSPLQPQCDGISARSVGAISVGIPPFLTLSEKPSALRDKSGALQNPDRFAPFQNFIIGIPSGSSHDSSMKIATIIARVLLGLIFVVFGSNIFLHFIPMPPPSPGLVGDFTKALFLSHYLHVVAVFQIVGGLLLLIGRFVPLGLLLLAPVIVNIDLVHILMDPSGLPMASVISILLVFLVWRYRDAFAGILRP